MPQPNASKRRISAATIALAAAGLLATAAVGIAVFRSGDTAGEEPANNLAAAAPAPSLDQSIAQLNQQLRADPDDHEKWYLLGLAYRDAGDYAGSEQAFRRAMQLAPRNPDYLAYLGEALLLKAGDAAPPAEAEQMFRRALEIQPTNPQSRYYLATLKDSRGEHRAAVDELLGLLREAPADAPWEPQVRAAVTGIAQRNHIDIAGRLPPPRQQSASASPATAAIPGPTREQMEAARGIPPSQQDAMVRGMVEGLANRLRQNPRDAEGWVRLMRSRKVLNDPDGARDALRSGLAAFQNDAATQQRLRAAANELGIPAG